MIAQWREWLYASGFLRAMDLPAFTVSVGNISLGGTGKSPFVMYLGEWALKRGLSTAVLTRGYKRKQKGLEIVGAGAPLPAVDRLGDEPWMIKCRLPGISLLVHADRARMAKRHWKELGEPKLVILDDAFQHWRAKRDRDVLMLDASESLTQGVFPFGRLRERASALARADLVVITRARSLSAEALATLERQVRDFAASPKLKPWKKVRGADLRIAAADYVFREFFRSDSGEPCGRPTEEKLILVSGVAKPDGVRGLAQSLNLPVVEEIYFPDHHALTAGDINRIKSALRSHGNAALLITEKDWARWREVVRGLPAYGIRVGFEFLGTGEARVSEFLAEVAKCSTSR